MASGGSTEGASPSPTEYLGPSGPHMKSWLQYDMRYDFQFLNLKRIQYALIVKLFLA